MDEEPELYIFRPSDPGDEWRAERKRQREESRRRHLERLVSVLAVADSCSDDPLARAEAVLDGLFVTRHRETDEPCTCSCHPQLPETDQHDYGSACPCRLTAAERRASWDDWTAEQDAYWASPEGREIQSREQFEEDALAAWLTTDPGVSITSHGGLAPEQWRGTVDGHSFYFRERHDHWRIELDLTPSGRFVELWTGADVDDVSGRKFKEIDEGEVIADGTTAVPGYGETPLERARFIVDQIRAHLRRRACTVHTNERDDLELLLGRPLEWCPVCGMRM